MKRAKARKSKSAADDTDMNVGVEEFEEDEDEGPTTTKQLPGGQLVAPRGGGRSAAAVPRPLVPARPRAFGSSGHCQCVHACACRGAGARRRADDAL